MEASENHLLEKGRQPKIMIPWVDYTHRDETAVTQKTIATHPCIVRCCCRIVPTTSDSNTCFYF